MLSYFFVMINYNNFNLQDKKNNYKKYLKINYFSKKKKAVLSPGSIFWSFKFVSVVKDTNTTKVYYKTKI